MQPTHCNLYEPFVYRHQHGQGALSSRHHAAPGTPALKWPSPVYRLGRRVCQLLLFLLLLTAPVTAHAASVTLAWDAIQPAPDGYRVFLRSSKQSYDYSSPAWQGTTPQCTIRQLADGTTYRAVARAFVDASESGDSNEVEFTTPAVSAGQAPVANAGPDQAVSAGTTVALDGAASQDPDGTLTAYQWIQTGGEAVTLTGETTARATFAAPGVNSNTTLTFQLTVVDNDGLSAADTCQVAVVPAAPLDSDNDGLSDIDETEYYHTDPNKADSDGDGLNDGEEIAAGSDPLIFNQAAASDKVWLEAEEGDIDLPMQIDGDDNASGGAYLWAPQGSGSWHTPSSRAGVARYTVDINASGTYRVWARVIAPTGRDDSFFVSMDGGAYKIWDTVRAASWTWDLVNARSEADPLLFQLAAGTHTLTLMQREDGAKVDRILITSDTRYIPEGRGEGQTADVAKEIVIEAESGNITSPMAVLADDTASTGACIWTPQGSGSWYSPSSRAGVARYSVDINASGTYRVWARVIAPTGRDDSFFVSMDGGAYKIWDTVRAASWTWDLVNARNEADPLLFQLSSGTHTLTLMQREDGAKIDKLIITQDAGFTPE